MAESDINHALAALDQLRDLIRAGEVDAWLLVSVPVADGYAPCGWAANTPIATERLGFRIGVIGGEINRQAWAQLLPNPEEVGK